VASVNITSEDYFGLAGPNVQDTEVLLGSMALDLAISNFKGKFANPEVADPTRPNPSIKKNDLTRPRSKNFDPYPSLP